MHSTLHFFSLQTGETATLLSEISGVVQAAGTPVVGITQPLRVFTNQTLPTIIVTQARPYLSSITMIAPSPDWFSGFYNFNAANSTTQRWLRSFTLETGAWDAGTEQGANYVMDNAAESPARRISQFRIGNLPNTNVFASPNGLRVLPVARWECRLANRSPSVAAPGRAPARVPVRAPAHAPAPSSCRTRGRSCANNSACCSGNCIRFASTFSYCG